MPAAVLLLGGPCRRSGLLLGLARRRCALVSGLRVALPLGRGLGLTAFHHRRARGIRCVSRALLSLSCLLSLTAGAVCLTVTGLALVGIRHRSFSVSARDNDQAD